MPRNQILSNLQDILNLLPNLNLDKLVRSMFVKTNDTHLVSQGMYNSTKEHRAPIAQISLSEETYKCLVGERLRHVFMRRSYTCRQSSVPLPLFTILSATRSVSSKRGMWQMRFPKTRYSNNVAWNLSYLWINYVHLVHHIVHRRKEEEATDIKPTAAVDSKEAPTEKPNEQK